MLAIKELDRLALLLTVGFDAGIADVALVEGILEDVADRIVGEWPGLVAPRDALRPVVDLPAVGQGTQPGVQPVGNLSCLVLLGDLRQGR